jgi:hypothetical protein
MFLAMYLGMALGPSLFLLAVGLSFDEALREHAAGFLLVMASSMTAPMIAWMLHRGHSRRGAAEMGLVMFAPALPLIFLVVAGVISGPICGTYCLASTVAMVALVVYRRGEYRTTAVPASKLGAAAFSSRE